MHNSFPKRRSRLKGAAQHRDLLPRKGPGWEFLEGAEGDAVSLAEGAVDGAGFGHAHLGVVEDQGRDVARMGVPIANETTALRGLVDCGFEHPIILLGTAERQSRLDMNASTVAPFG